MRALGGTHAWILSWDRGYVASSSTGGGEA